MSKTINHLYSQFGGTNAKNLEMLEAAEQQGRNDAWKFTQQYLADIGDTAGQICAWIMWGLLNERSNGDERQCFEKARHLARTTQGAKGEALCCLEIADLSPANALSYAHTAANLYAEQLEQAGQGKAYFLMGKGLLCRYQLAGARKYLADAINLLKSTRRDQELAWALHYMHRAVTRPEAERYLQESLALSANDIQLKDLNLAALSRQS